MTCLPVNEIRQIYNGEDILNSLSYDAIEDIKDRVWELLKDELNYLLIVDKIRTDLKNAPDTEIEDEEENEEDYETQENSCNED